MENEEQNVFLNKIQNAHSMWFPHRFSTLRSKFTPKGPPDGYGLPLAMKWDSFIATGLFGSIFFLKQSLCIYPYAELCFFSVGSTYFSKNHPNLGCFF